METETKVTDEQKEKLAYYRVISDAYKQRFKFRSVLFHCIMNAYVKQDARRNHNILSYERDKLFTQL